MKKSSFVALLLGTVSGVLFALGMCMALISEWNSFRPGVVLSGAGLLLGIVTVLVWRKMEGKRPLRLSGKTLFAVVLGIAGALTLGVGMCFCMVWDKMIFGIALGLVGLVLLLCLVPLTKGLQD